MSEGKFKLLGKCIYLTTSHSRKWYYDNKKTRWFINQEIIQKADSNYDFSEFDNLTRKGSYSFTDSSDGKVDMIFVIFRNVANDLPDTLKGKYENEFNLVPGGEASLGGGKSFEVDNGKRIVDMNYPGSGVTVKINDLHNIPVSGCAHELGHYLLGGNEMHFNKGMYGLMSSWGYTQRSIMMNGWERYKVGWLTLKSVGPKNGNYKVKLDDYLTTGDAAKISIPDSKEYFILENHQLINKFWDIPDQSGSDVKGVYVLRVSGTTGNSVTLICADGRWDWEVNKKVANPYGGNDSLPVFQKLREDKVNGYFDNEMIPFNYNGKFKSDFIHFHQEPGSDKIIEQAIFRGDGHDRFNLTKNTFGADTNPNSQLSNKKPSGISFIITSKSQNKNLSDSYLINITIQK